MGPATANAAEQTSTGDGFSTDNTFVNSIGNTLSSATHNAVCLIDDDTQSISWSGSFALGSVTYTSSSCSYD